MTKSTQTTRGTGRPPRSPRVWVAAAIVGLVGLSMASVSPAGADTSTIPASGDPSTTVVPLTTTSTSSTVVAPAPTPDPRRGSIYVTPKVTTQLNGAGSSFAAPAIEAFTKAVQQPPYSLSVNYTSTSSGDGRYEFSQNTTNYAVSDIAYGLGSTDTTPPSFKFIYVPITAGGIAFMYNIPGLTKTLQLSSYTACALLTGGITNWNDPALAADNPGVALPNLVVRPVTESDSAGTNFVLEEWCINQQGALWAAFANQQNHQSGGPGDGVVISATQPESNWPGLPGGLDQQSTSGVAGSIATTPGAIGAVQVKYASDLGFGPTTPPKGVAAVKNASGKYTQPTPVDVASALAYATQNDNGTHQLNFAGVGPNVYNPSTYSYLLAKTTGSDPSLGAVLSGFVNYGLTLGQQASPTFGYASLGLSLEKYGVDQVKANVPGAVAPTASELNAYSCGDLTPTEVQNGQTTPTCGVLNTAAQAGGAAAAAAAAAAGAHVAGAAGSSGSGSSTSGSSGSGVDAGVSLSGTSGLAFTGSNPVPLVVLGTALVMAAWLVRRRLRRRTPVEERG
jgi:ABC-type phosphate transport system substrate-binding protein